ncbi:hypothetical protein EXS66_02645, partial [Candidatus Saccharibacteria bacterium]|nr:hypothetical protein [Candidatus Saccharibacteria bacterium]
MNDKQTPQSKPTNSQSTKPIEDSFNASSSAKLNTPNKPGIRPNLMSGQVEATPIISENTFQQSSATGATPHSTLTAKPTAIPGQLKAKRFNSKLIGLGSVLGLLVLASIGLFITYNSYQKSYQKLQQSRVSNNISST